TRPAATIPAPAAAAGSTRSAAGRIDGSCPCARPSFRLLDRQQRDQLLVALEQEGDALGVRAELRRLAPGGLLGGEVGGVDRPVERGVGLEACSWAIGPCAEERP